MNIWNLYKYDELVERVELLEKSVEKASDPKWLDTGLGSADLSGMISYLEFIEEGWRTLSIGLSISNKDISM